jgi:hypothetical protein
MSIWFEATTTKDLNFLFEVYELKINWYYVAAPAEKDESVDDFLLALLTVKAFNDPKS